MGCDLHVKHLAGYWKLYGVSLLTESAAIPPEVQHRDPGEIQGFPYF